MGKKLTLQSFQKAQRFIFEQGRELDQVLFKFYFGDGTEDEVLQSLSSYRNLDGGFGNGLEPDTLMPHSSVIATTVALQTMRQIGVDTSDPFVWDTAAYLVNNFDEQAKTWPVMHRAVDDYPHAPWWNYNPDLSLYMANPGPEVLGYLLDYRKLMPKGFCGLVSRKIFAYLENLEEPLEMHELLCYLRLMRTESLSEEKRQLLDMKLKPMVLNSVAKTPQEWQSYGLKPLQVCDDPDAPYADLLQDALSSQLDFEIDQQGSDGAWNPNWDWGDAYPQDWPKAEKLWKSRLTFKMLQHLDAFDRLDF